MDIRSGLDGLRSLFGVDAATQAAPQAKSREAESASALTQDSATVSNAGSEVATTANEASERLDKVASIQEAIASGTYHVPASAVASKMVDSLLAEQ